ncbi:aldo/keto reductase [Ramlibacter solisilvae]|uniref:Aldo/keto reductase n=1 Tax=Ramlibacter tataouinensis TaxID=94132 RepID=A0A127JSB5_9BURK|nr:aldo/keto reductase [Ramlibacter tataouinensis]AMO22849.1 aldo/keto reductase [Ramlibacter tataouinensis]
MQRRPLLLWLPASLPASAWAQAGTAAPLLTRPIPSSGERLPAIGLGSWITFNVGDDAAARRGCAQVIGEFFARGGRLIDSSPMYGSSQSVIGDALQSLGARARVFSADKVWTSSDGAAQAEASRRHWRVDRFDLLQVHNLLAWEKQLPLIEAMKAQGRLRYVGITTSEGRRHREIEQIMRSQPLDFVQLTYNPVDREAEQRLLPLAAERGIAVLANRPFQEGALLRRLQRHPLPAWAAETDCGCWAQLVLKFIVTHPAVTCAIPATSRIEHLRENMGAAQGRLPDAELRRRIAEHIKQLV